MYQGRRFIREQVYICGDYLDTQIYPVFQAPGKRRKKCKPTKEMQEQINQRNAERKLTRLAHANFTPDDLALHLTYRPGTEPTAEEDAKKNLSNYLRRLKRLYKKLDIEFKYISCIEIGKKGRVHNHLIISGGADRDELEKLWGFGYANSKRLQFGDDGITGLARYMVKDKHFYKRWNQSRNLIIPEPVQRDGELTVSDASDIAAAVEAGTVHLMFEELYPEFVFVEAVAKKNVINKGEYIFIQMRRREPFAQQSCHHGPPYPKS